MKNVCFLFGINGVGKSTLAQVIVRQAPGAVHLSGSEVLRGAFGRISREELERIDMKVKRAMKRDALLHAFDQNRRAALVVCDTHLTVAIRSECGVTHEHVWDEAYAEYGTAYCNIVASEVDVLRRRQEDERATGRKRSLEMTHVIADAKVNDAAFARIFGGVDNAHVISNVSSAHAAARRVLRRLALPTLEATKSLST